MTTGKRFLYGALLAFAGAVLWLGGHAITSYDRGGISVFETWMGGSLLVLAAVVALSGLASPGDDSESEPTRNEKKPKR